MEIQAQQTAGERQQLEQLRRRVDEERQSAEASTGQATEQEKRKLIRAREQLETNKGAFVDEREREKYNDGIGKNVGGCCSTMKTSCLRRVYR